MSKGIVKIMGSIAGNKATQLCIKGKGWVWFPKGAIHSIKGNKAIISSNILDEKEIEYENITHTPKKMEVITNQEAIDELKC